MQLRKARSGDAPYPFIWDTAQTCLDWSRGIVTHFPMGSYREQVSNELGRRELMLMRHVWNCHQILEMTPQQRAGNAQIMAAYVELVKPDDEIMH